MQGRRSFDSRIVRRDAVANTPKPSRSGSASGRSRPLLRALGPRPAVCPRTRRLGRCPPAGRRSSGRHPHTGCLHQGRSRQRARALPAGTRQGTRRPGTRRWPTTIWPAGRRSPRRRIWPAARPIFTAASCCYRRKDFAQCRGGIRQRAEFRDAPARCVPMRRAWRHLAAVAGGSCGSARASLWRTRCRGFAVFPEGRRRVPWPPPAVA